jgi:hypothetical protein
LQGGVPDEFNLAQNYPNPFNPVTRIVYQIPASAFVNLKVYNILGQEVKTLVNEVKEAGTYSVTFDAGTLPSGLYFYRVVSGRFVDTKRLLVLK